MAGPAHIIDKINACIDEKKPFIAFEYFPPRTADGVTNLYARVERMAKQQPLYGDVTWGAGGTTSDLTLELCVESKKRFGLEMNMHLTWCVGARVAGRCDAVCPLCGNAAILLLP